ncbi:MAG TPA: TetR/AcrR family transcriptional regulator [Hyphomonas sp.]|nr:TetR/AcrR family transcriptional regulator [Hyphomonas sp.]HRX73229.1 TetR/AcrR family transcriptional regulator [Hyphomonas sp.]
MDIDPTTVESAATEDGRRQRSERNRQKIVAAMFELVREGDFDPSVARIAEQAGVGLRTVFRHFDDVDSLYQEMSSQMEARILPEIGKPLTAKEWPDRVKELMARRIRIFEDVMPIRICASARRFRSEFLMANHKRFVAQEAIGLSLALPDEVLANEHQVAAFDIAMSFDTWRRLRQDHRFSRAKAAASVETILDALIASV